MLKGALGLPTAFVETVVEALPYESPATALMLSDTALAGATVDLTDIGAHFVPCVVILRSTLAAGALTWDAPGSSELVLPASVKGLARLLGTDCRDRGEIAVDQ
jgi:hypothetical protein